MANGKDSVCDDTGGVGGTTMSHKKQRAEQTREEKKKKRAQASHHLSIMARSSSSGAMRAPGRQVMLMGGTGSTTGSAAGTSSMEDSNPYLSQDVSILNIIMVCFVFAAILGIILYYLVWYQHRSGSATVPTSGAAAKPTPTEAMAEPTTVGTVQLATMFNNPLRHEKRSHATGALPLQGFLQTCGAYLQTGGTLQRGASPDGFIPPDLSIVTLNPDGTLTARYVPSTNFDSNPSPPVTPAAAPFVLGLSFSVSAQLDPSSPLIPIIQFLSPEKAFGQPAQGPQYLQQSKVIPGPMGSVWAVNYWVPFRFQQIESVNHLFTVGMFVASIQFPVTNGSGFSPIQHYVLSTDVNPFAKVRPGTDIFCVPSGGQSQINLTVIPVGTLFPSLYASPMPDATDHSRDSDSSLRIQVNAIPPNQLFQIGISFSADQIFREMSAAIPYIPSVGNSYVRVAVTESQRNSGGLVPVWGPMKLYVMAGGRQMWLVCENRFLLLGDTFGSPFYAVFCGGALFIVSEQGVILWQTGSFDVWSRTSSQHHHQQSGGGATLLFQSPMSSASGMSIISGQGTNPVLWSVSGGAPSGANALLWQQTSTMNAFFSNDDVKHLCLLPSATITTTP